MENTIVSDVFSGQDNNITYQNKLLHVEKSILVNVAEIPDLGEKVEWQLRGHHVRLHLAAGQLAIDWIQRAVGDQIFLNICGRYLPIEGTHNIVALQRVSW